MKLTSQNYEMALTVCPFCGVGCNLLVENDSAFPLRHHRITQGALSLRGWSAGELFNSPVRVKTAFVRSSDGSLQPIETTQAIKLVIEQVQTICNRYGNEAVGILGSARLTNEENMLIRQLAVALGTPNLDSFQRLGYLPFAPLNLEAIDGATEVTVVGVDLAHRHPQVFKRVSKVLQQGKTVRFVDFRQVQLSRLATEHICPMPGES